MIKTYCDKCGKELEHPKQQADIVLEIFLYARNTFRLQLCYSCTSELADLFNGFVPNLINKERMKFK